jgi:plasmid stabilization system protein ParE
VTYTVFLREEAEADIADAAAWYEEQWDGLGHAFLEQVERGLERIGERPQQYPELHRQIRRALIQRFPFGIFFQQAGNHIVVLGVLHASRNPRHWKERS